MWVTVAQDLEDKTKKYWKISSVWNNRTIEEIPTQDAINLCKGNLLYTNPQRPVALFSSRLLQEIIIGEGSPNLPETSEPIPFPDLLDIVSENMQ